MVKDKVKHYTVNDSNFRLCFAILEDRSLLELTTTQVIKILLFGRLRLVKDKILHIDFQEVTRGQNLVAKVPLVVEGEAEGVKNMGGILEILLNEIEVKCRPSKLPAQVLVDVSKLNMGENLQIKDLIAIDGVEFTAEPTTNLVSCVGSASGRAGASSDDDETDESSPEGTSDETESADNTASDAEQS